jgi:hypothetical protein
VTTWHVDESLCRRYADGDTDLALAASVETHVAACAACRERVATGVPEGRLAGIWAGIAAEVDAPRLRLIERVLVRLGMREDTARLVVTTPSLTLSWLISLVLVLGFAAVAADFGIRGRLVFLTAAPLLPVIGVAAAFSATLDPLGEVTAAVPYPRIRLVLVRSAAVLVVSIGSAAAAGLLVLDGWLAAAWLLPALSMVATLLALWTRFDAGYAGAAVGVVWIALVWCRAPLQHVSLAVFAPAAQVVYVLVIVIAWAVLVAARRTFDQRRRSW